MERVDVYLLHGFLGKGSDWASVIAGMPAMANVFFHPLDYMKLETLNSFNSFEEWASQFNNQILEHASRKILVGYSLGGRLALQALKKDPSKWDHVLLLSTNPGFDDDIAGEVVGSPLREDRWLKDTEWAQLFKQAPWNDLLRSWNAQSVFIGSKAEPKRLEGDYDRHLLEMALTNWSLAMQDNMRPLLKAYEKKITWLTGELDTKFLQQAESLQLLHGIAMNYVTVTGASHRILFDAPLEVARQLLFLIQDKASA